LVCCTKKNLATLIHLLLYIHIWLINGISNSK
jgi:hypothetical protein